MAAKMTNSQVSAALRAGPGSQASVPEPKQVQRLADDRPEIFDYLMRKLCYSLAESSFRRPERRAWKAYRDFMSPWLSRIDRDSARMAEGIVSAYGAAADAGLGELTAMSAPRDAAAVARRLSGMPVTEGSAQEMLLLSLTGQIQSLVSREEAGASFEAVRQHRLANRLHLFSWETGALGYYSAQHLQSTEPPGPMPVLRPEWVRAPQGASRQAFVVSVDKAFFETYGPSMIFTAQQLPEIDLVVLLCAEVGECSELIERADVYQEALSAFNRSPVSGNVAYLRVSTPHWVGDERTFYACARFLVQEELLAHYENLYTMDADLILKDDPTRFLSRTAELQFATPFNAGPVGVVPWRRYMAGSAVAHQSVQGTGVLESLTRYICHGLRQEHAWTLDQNALSFAAEQSEPGSFATLERHPRPVVVSSFMARWEKNHKAAVRQGETGLSGV